tara:strand:+ start:700 stop:2058 length:1359 start_codon:yes stop_codon:yes gene_type:complete
MIKLIIFDLDGVLVEAKEIHYDALNIALGAKYKISLNDHLSRYDGLKTNDKLELLNKEKGLPKELFPEIWSKKQKETLLKLKEIKTNNDLIKLFKFLSQNEYKIAVCSNSIRKTILTVLSKIGIIEYVDLILSNEDVKTSKPHPEIFWKAMSYFTVLPEETLILEDSPAGLSAAHKAKGNILRIKSPKEVKLNLVIENIKKYNMKNNLIPKWKDKKLNVLIPMAGAGSRFEKAGYTFPKPLIEVEGKPMIQLVVENLNIDANYIFVVQKSHREKYNLDSLLKIIVPDCKIVEVDGLTDGAACTALLASKYIDNDSPLFFANSDQYVVWDSNEFFYKMNESKCDGGIVLFKATHPKWSFAKLDKNNRVIKVAEKNPISDNATVGFYYWNKGSDFVKYANKMIDVNDRVNNEFYVCPVFNHAIKDGKMIIGKEVSEMFGIGTPEDLNIFLGRNK